MATPILQLDSAAIGFGPPKDRVDTLKDVNLAVAPGEFVAVIGFSGSGKSTLVSLLAGLQRPTAGRALMNGEPIPGPGPERGIMFQNYSLLPWLSVAGNVELAVKSVFKGCSKSQAREHAARYIEMVNLTPAKDKKPHELSGGMRQRVSLARTLALQPKVLLLDEPLSALDALTRAVLQDEILRIREQEKITVVLITNDVDEAILMADRIIPLTRGPEATLAEAFPVPLPRPRDRRTLNECPDYQRLKAEITSFLIRLNREAKSREPVPVLRMPEIAPKSFRAPSRILGLKWKLSS